MKINEGNDTETKLKVSQLLYLITQNYEVKFDIGDVIRIDGVNYQIIGFDTSSQKHPILVETLIDEYKYNLD